MTRKSKYEYTELPSILYFDCLVLGIASNEKKATHCKIVCLMQLDKFDEALTTIIKNSLDTGYKLST